MTAGSILPITIIKNQLYFLFGKENSMEDSHKGFSDFGGGCENNETPFQTALREGAEETTFFFGNKNDVKKMIHKAGGFYPLVYNNYHCHLFFLNYDENLVKYYNNNHINLWNRFNKKQLNDSKLFEKIELKWFSIRELKTKRHLFRKFYREIIDKILDELSLIKKFIRSKKNKSIKNICRRGGVADETETLNSGDTVERVYFNKNNNNKTIKKYKK